MAPSYDGLPNCNDCSHDHGTLFRLGLYHYLPLETDVRIAVSTERRAAHLDCQLNSLNELFRWRNDFAGETGHIGLGRDYAIPRDCSHFGSAGKRPDNSRSLRSFRLRVLMEARE